MKDENYIKIYGWMTKLGLSGNKLIIFALIYGFSVDDKKFNGSYGNISDRINLDRSTVIRLINSLRKSGLIIRENNKFGNSFKVFMKNIKSNLLLVAKCHQSQNATSRKMPPHQSQNATPTSGKMPPNNKYINNNINNKNFKKKETANAENRNQKGLIELRNALVENRNIPKRKLNDNKINEQRKKKGE